MRFLVVVDLTSSPSAWRRLQVSVCSAAPLLVLRVLAHPSACQGALIYYNERPEISTLQVGKSHFASHFVGFWIHHLLTLVPWAAVVGINGGRNLLIA